jgi:hypothetical protein
MTTEDTREGAALRATILRSFTRAVLTLFCFVLVLANFFLSICSFAAEAPLRQKKLF